MPTAARQDPILQHRFLVEIAGVTAAGFNEVTGLDSSTTVVEYRNGDEIRTVRKLPGLHTYSNIVFKIGMISTDSTLYQFREKIVNEQQDRINVTVHLQDETGATVKTWDIREAWPCKYVMPEFNAQGNAVSIETLEMAHEGIVEA